MHVPRTCDVPVTFPWRIRDVSVLYIYLRVYGVSRRMWYVRVTYVWRMKCPRDVSSAYVIALSHIHVSAAYRSRITENFDTPRSEPYFVRATYVPRTRDVPATFPWRISDVSVFEWNFTFVCTAYLRTCNVCMAYEVYA